MNQRAFTLVETLVALFVLSIAITAAFAVITFNLNSANSIKNSFIASGLAQEGIELARNLRDTDWHRGKAFGSFGSSGPVPNDDYCVQWNSSELFSCSGDLLKDAEGMYQHDEGSPTTFRRKVSIFAVSSAEIRVIVEVSWKEKTGTKTINAEQHLYNWY